MQSSSKLSQVENPEDSEPHQLLNTINKSSIKKVNENYRSFDDDIDHVTEQIKGKLSYGLTTNNKLFYSKQKSSKS